VISEAVKSAILENTKYSADTHTVTFDLTNVSADYGANKVVLDGDSFSVNLKANDTLSVTVMMGGQNITDDVYNNGNITIEKVTADVIITAINIHKPQNYRFEFNGTDLESVGKTENILTKKAGTTANGVFSKTCYSLDKAVVLSHNEPWQVEWKCDGTFLNTNGSSGARIFTTTPVNAEYNARYIFKSNTNGLIAMGEKTATGSHNYGIALGDHGIDWTAPHTYRLENRIADDGSNMIWLYVDGKEIGPMTGYYIGTNSQNKTSDWLSGKDFVFSYMGTDTHGFTNASIDYIQVWEGGHSHTYENGICTGCGATVSPYLQQLPENIIGCTNLYDSLAPVKGYYTATKYDTSNGNVLSVVIPVEPGDRIAASSFGAVSENMGSVDGIRVTYLLGNEIVSSLSAGDVYSGYTTNGYITVPDGVDAVCVPWWKPSDSNWLTLSQISKNFAVHIPKTVSAQAPTCTENGYTAGEICEICNASLGEREELPATGHSYSGDTCTICGSVNLLAILDGKYVSILGDSISTFNGYSNNATVNSTISGNGHRYDAGTADTKPGSFCLLESVNDTWWMHFANRSGMKLLVNNSWAGSQVFGGKTSDGRVIPAAYLDRCVNLHDNTLDNNPGNAPINPDVIFVYLGINDYNFNRSKVGTGTVDYAGLVNSDGTYVTPETFGEAYGIMLHKMRNTYPDAQIFAMTLLPENLYSVDKNAWEQHNTYIRAAAEYYDIPLIDLAENCAITWENYSRYMIDKIHPTTAGMKLISNCIEAELASYYKQNPPHTHDYISEVTYPDGLTKGWTDYTCQVCGDSYRTPWLDAHAYEGMTIACVGDSITAAVGVTKDENDYVKLLAEQLGMDYIRLGVSGTTLCTNGSRTSNISRLTEGYLKGADVVTIAMGINDFCAAGAGYYELGDINSTDSSTIYGAARMWCERIMELRKTDGMKDTQFCFVTPVICSWNNSVTSARDWDQSKINIHGYTLRELCNAIIEVAALYDVPVVDLNLISGMYYVSTEDNNVSEFGGDGVHPGANGHAMMANALANALLQNDKRTDHEHIFGSWVSTTWPTCLEGEEQRVCTQCTKTECRTLQANGAHRYNAAITLPNCTEKGYTTYTCECGESYVGDYLDALGHKFGQYISNDDATVTSDGTKTAVCERDGCKTTDTVPDVGTKLLLGDMNNDKLLDTDDAIYLLRHILMPDSYHVKQSANVNGDDVTDTDDAIYLLRHVLLPNSYPLKLTE